MLDRAKVLVMEETGIAKEAQKGDFVAAIALALKAKEKLEYDSSRGYRLEMSSDRPCKPPSFPQGSNCNDVNDSSASLMLPTSLLRLSFLRPMRYRVNKALPLLRCAVDRALWRFIAGGRGRSWHPTRNDDTNANDGHGRQAPKSISFRADRYAAMVQAYMQLDDLGITASQVHASSFSLPSSLKSKLLKSSISTNNLDGRIPLGEDLASLIRKSEFREGAYFDDDTDEDDDGDEDDDTDDDDDDEVTTKFDKLKFGDLGDGGILAGAGDIRGQDCIARQGDSRDWQGDKQNRWDDDYDSDDELRFIGTEYFREVALRQHHPPVQPSGYSGNHAEQRLCQTEVELKEQCIPPMRNRGTGGSDVSDEVREAEGAAARRCIAVDCHELALLSLPRRVECATVHQVK